MYLTDRDAPERAVCANGEATVPPPGVDGDRVVEAWTSGDVRGRAVSGPASVPSKRLAVAAPVPGRKGILIFGVLSGGKDGRPGS